MNHLFALLIAIFLTSCKSFDCDYPRGQQEATVYFINETSAPIVSKQGCQRDIAPKDTLIFHAITESIYDGGIDNFPINEFICTMSYQDGEILKCEKEIENIESYEKKEKEYQVFELTFRFTEEKKAKATACN